ncbi:hypothetical protein Y1Q_0021720 [Alligator mississippiensis]|uniref:Uncharacterized protein n=1 Tax=Alligator mississippiensis TaxID=8496 RepID=A0A151PB14_ALLMI|nr:hypothetical protein Y1Q_0021720 [Alligator mississippiensis]
MGISRAELQLRIQSERAHKARENLWTGVFPTEDLEEDWKIYSYRCLQVKDTPEEMLFFRSHVMFCLKLGPRDQPTEKSKKIHSQLGDWSYHGRRHDHSVKQYKLSIILTPGPNFCLLKDCRRKPGVTTSRTSSYLPHTYLEGSQRMLLSVYACGSVIFDFFPRGVTEGGWTKRKKPQHFKPTKKLRSFWLVFGHRHCRGPVPTFWYLLEE